MNTRIINLPPLVQERKVHIHSLLSLEGGRIYLSPSLFPNRNLLTLTYSPTASDRPQVCKRNLGEVECRVSIWG